MKQLQFYFFHYLMQQSMGIVQAAVWPCGVDKVANKVI